MTETPGSAGSGSEREPLFLADERRRIDATLRLITSEAVPRLVPALREPLAYALGTTGKRIRPALCVTAWKLAKSVRPDDETSDETRAASGRTADARTSILPDMDPDSAPAALYQLACAVEIVHTYSLIHDDLPCMDDDDLRRGRPTVHRIFGEGSAMLAGAALLPLAVEVLVAGTTGLGFGPAMRGAMLTELARAAGAEGMVGGQLLDLEAEGCGIDGPQLESIHQRKTGALLVASLRIGAIAGGAGEGLLNALTRYGQALGLAFQIADDLLDVEGSAADLGKAAGRDEALRKASYPALYGVDAAHAMARAKVSEAIAAVFPYGSVELAALARYVEARRA